jgi:zinc protease
VALEKRRRIARIGQEQAQPVTIAQRLAPPLLYGAAHPYGKPLTGSGFAATVEPLGREDFARWHRDWFRPGSATLVVTGDVTMAELLPALERTLGGWPAGEAPAKRLDVPAVVGDAGARGTVYLVDKPDAPQSVIVAAHVSAPGGLAEDLAIETVLRNFGGMATSRLNRNLRLDKHWSYGTAGLLVGARGARPFVVIAPVQTDRTKEAMAEVAMEIRGVAGERPVAGEELASLRRNQTLRLPGRFETLAALESAALDIVRYGYAESYFADYGKNVRALTEEDLAAAAARVVRPSELIWIVVGDLAKVESGIRELDYGEIVRLDADGSPLP